MGVILEGKNVDVSQWQRFHPGGAKVLKIFENRDATEQFYAMHSKKAISQLQVMLKKSEPSTDIKSPQKALADFKQLRNDFEKNGFFQPSLTSETFKLLYVHFCVFVGSYFIFSSVSWVFWLGMFLFILGQHQAGWVSHDYSHHSVLSSPKKNDLIAFWIGLLQGYDLQWWKARHNTHHVVTNEVGNDPDIKTAPLLHFVQQYGSQLPKVLGPIQKYQVFYYLPSLMVLDLYWRFESVMYVFKYRRYFAAFALLFQYVALFLLFFPIGFRYFLFFSLARGWLTGIIVFATHYGEERLEGTQSVGDVKGKSRQNARQLTFVEQTVRTSRNIQGNSILHFFTGNISYQIEHHLFPQMPRSNLPLIQPQVRDFCRTHQLVYQEATLWECTKHLLTSLSIGHVFKE
eukprot:Lithocolla_globosa_v1_NODE_897_length_3115_cov_8.205229.p1 type:complete len:402 gc:universal NODE_897_length_3115_cov_8.205229:1657-2862(+)